MGEHLGSWQGCGDSWGVHGWPWGLGESQRAMGCFVGFWCHLGTWGFGWPPGTVDIRGGLWGTTKKPWGGLGATEDFERPWGNI